MRTSALWLVPTLALCLAACGAPSAEKKIEDAAAQVDRAEEEVESAKQALEREQAELDEAREELEGARDALRGAESRLVEAQQHMGEVADDAFLFRAVQSALLADPALEDMAIGARVRDGVVTLEGQVPDADSKQRAGTLAAAVPGVKRVDNSVGVELALE